MFCLRSLWDTLLILSLTIGARARAVVACACVILLLYLTLCLFACDRTLWSLTWLTILLVVFHL